MPKIDGGVDSTPAAQVLETVAEEEGFEPSIELLDPITV
jgi:hypothetical protein